MSLNKSQDRIFNLIDGNVLTTGGTLNLANGQLAILDLSLPNTQNGRRAVSTFQGKPKDTNFQIKLGVAPIAATRSLSDKPWSSVPFKLSEVVDFKVYAPKVKGQKVDSFIIGYNGKAGTEIVLKENSSDVIDITLSGEAIGALGYQDNSAKVTLYLEYPYVDENGLDIATGLVPSMQEIIENAVNVFKRMTLMGGVSILDYIDIAPVNSLSPSLVAITNEVAYVTFKLTLADNGDHTALGRVQAQYPAWTIIVADRLEDSNTVYTVIAPAATVIAPYTTSTPSYIKGCEACTVGYTEAVAGVVYSIAIENDGVDVALTIDNVPGFVVGSVLKQAQNGGTAIYTVVVDNALTEAEIVAFKATDALSSTAVFTLVGEASAVCESAASTSTSWVAGETCNAIPEAYTITLSDDECGASKLPALQAAYPNLVITAGASALCQTTYSTSVLSNIVCEDCSKEFRDLFVTAAPSDFERISWEKAAKVYNPLALMGIKITGKEFIMSGTEEFLDDMPFYASSTRISVAGGYTTFTTENFIAGTGRFAVKMLSAAEAPEALGGFLRDQEERSRIYFDGTHRLDDNLYGRWAMGQETRLKGLAQYVDYALTVDVKTPTQNLGEANERITYHVSVEVGRHQAVEVLLNKLAAAAGLPAVQAYS